MKLEAKHKGGARMKSHTWRLYCQQLGLWAGLDAQNRIVPCESAEDPRVQIFDQRDSKEAKTKFYSLVTGVVWKATA